MCLASQRPLARGRVVGSGSAEATPQATGLGSSHRTGAPIGDARAGTDTRSRRDLRNARRAGPTCPGSLLQVRLGSWQSVAGVASACVTPLGVGRRRSFRVRHLAAPQPQKAVTRPETRQLLHRLHTLSSDTAHCATARCVSRATPQHSAALSGFKVVQERACLRLFRCLFRSFAPRPLR